MGTSTGSTIGVWKQPSPQAARLRLVLWMALFLGAGAVVVIVGSKPSTAAQPGPDVEVVIAFFALMGAGIAFVLDVIKSFGGKAIEVRAEGILLKNPRGEMLSAIEWRHIQSCLMVPRKSASGYSSGHLAVTALALAQTEAGVPTFREGDLRVLDALIRTNDQDAIRIDATYRDRIVCMKTVAQTMNAVMLPDLIQRLENGESLQFSALTISRDGLHSEHKTLLPWNNISQVILGGLSVIVHQRDLASGKERKFTHVTAGLDRLLLFNLIKRYATTATFSEQ